MEKTPYISTGIWYLQIFTLLLLQDRYVHVVSLPL